LTFFVVVFLGINTFGQNTQSDSLTNTSKRIEIQGLLLDSASQAPLAYANIFLTQSKRGMISNEQGNFAIELEENQRNDSLRFQYIGYATKTIAVAELNANATVYLAEKISDLSETIVFGNAPNPVDIVKQVLIHKDSNYRRTNYSRNEIFFRERENVDFKEAKLNYKKSSIPNLDKEIIEKLENKIPKHTTSFTDFLGEIYFSASKKDSIPLKIKETRSIALKEKEINDLDQFEHIFENAFQHKEKGEYWKVRSGIFASKIDDDNDGDNERAVVVNVDTTQKETGRRALSSFRNSLHYSLKYSNLTDPDQWEFLHKTGRYKYRLAGGTRVNGEDVYIIDFTPRNSGRYRGRMYIARESFALIRADYTYAEGKTGQNIHLLGVGYTETQFSGSVYFEKRNNTYELNYFSYKSSERVSIERSIALVKKKTRPLFDKKLMELKLGLIFTIETEESKEYLVLDNQIISRDEYNTMEQGEFMNTLFVDQYNDRLWNGYPIIEPTQRMKEYKKQALDLKVE